MSDLRARVEALEVRAQRITGITVEHLAIIEDAVALCEELLARLQKAEAAIDAEIETVNGESAIDAYRAAHPKEASAGTYCTCGGKPIVAGTTTHYMVCAECGKPKEE